MDGSKRLVWLDGLRLIAGVSMVGLHASADIKGQPFPEFTALERAGAVFFRSIMYLARTELFLIISLFLLFMSLDMRPRGYWETVYEQAKRLLRPFVFWVVFYAFYRLIKAIYFGYEAAIIDQLLTPQSWIGYFVLGDVQYHMHFLPTLFGLILFYPLCLCAIKYPWLGVVVLMCLFTKRECDLWLWAHKDIVLAFEYVLRLVKVLTYVGYACVAASAYGLYRKHQNWLGLNEVLPFILLVGGFLYLLKIIYSLRVIEFANWQYNYAPAFWADFLMPVVLFFLFMSSRRVNKWRWLSSAAPYSFGIYLVHPIFLDIAEIMLWDFRLLPIVFVLAKTVWAVFLATTFVIFLSKTPLAWSVGLGRFPNLRAFSRLLKFKGFST